MAQELDRFFKAITKDNRCHLELRTDLSDIRRLLESSNMVIVTI